MVLKQMFHQARLLGVVEVEPGNGPNPLKVVVKAVVLVGRVNGIAIKPKTHEYGLNSQFALKKGNNRNGSAIAGWNRLSAVGFCHRLVRGAVPRMVGRADVGMAAVVGAADLTVRSR